MLSGPLLYVSSLRKQKGVCSHWWRKSLQQFKSYWDTKVHSALKANYLKSIVLTSNNTSFELFFFKKNKIPLWWREKYHYNKNIPTTITHFFTYNVVYSAFFAWLPHLHMARGQGPTSKQTVVAYYISECTVLWIMLHWPQWSGGLFFYLGFVGSC